MMIGLVVSNGFRAAKQKMYLTPSSKTRLKQCATHRQEERGSLFASFLACGRSCYLADISQGRCHSQLKDEEKRLSHLPRATSVKWQR